VAQPSRALWARGVDAQGAPGAADADRDPTWVVNELLTLAVTEPTIGCRQYADRLADSGYQIAKSTVQDIPVRHGLGRRAQRVARAAAITALSTGLVTETAVEDDLFGFCHWAARPGDLVALASFYIGNLKGVGKMYQLTIGRFSKVVGAPPSCFTSVSTTQPHQRRQGAEELAQCGPAELVQRLEGGHHLVAVQDRPRVVRPIPRMSAMSSRRRPRASFLRRPMSGGSDVGGWGAGLPGLEAACSAGGGAVTR
jgi:hypothetical protein